MRTLAASLPLLLMLLFITPAHAQETQRSDVVVEKMSFKLARGVANMATCVVELPKQIYLTSQNRGAATGFVIGPLKGIGMTLYRALTGITETAFFLVPQPGYYDPMINPEFVWKGWEEARADHAKGKDPDPADPPVEKKGE